LFRRFLGLFVQNSDRIFRQPCFEGLSSRASRASAAVLFAYFLVSKSRKWAWLTQNEPYSQTSYLTDEQQNCRVE
jgi:hypothetical protein